MRKFRRFSMATAKGKAQVPFAGLGLDLAATLRTAETMTLEPLCGPADFVPPFVPATKVLSGSEMLVRLCRETRAG